MRLLFNVPNVILQPFAIIERSIGFSFHALPRVYIMDTELFSPLDIFASTYWFD